MKTVDCSKTNYWDGLRVDTIGSDNPFEYCPQEQKSEQEQTEIDIIQEQEPEILK